MMTVKIMIVDDIEANRYSLQALLEDNMTDVTLYLASDGEEALKMVLKEEIDIIILDIQMPGMDGFEVAQYLKKNPKTRDIPIIFLTAAFKTDEFKKNGFKVGAVDYLTKPVEDYQIINKINLYVDLYKQKIELKTINKNLEERISNGIAELRKKDKLLIQQSKMAAMGEMIGIITHQWKQPLNVLSLVTQNLQQAFDMNRLDSAYINKTVTKTMKQINYMSETIDDFKNFFSPNKQKEAFSIKQSIQQTIDILASQLQNESIEITIIGEDSSIYNYKNEFQQVVMNIVNNAIDALLENKSDKMEIIIEIEKNNTNICISISDNAGGIPAGIIDNIFDSYFTTKGEKGTGLGLYMVKMIVQDSLEGTISVTNNANGACFSVCLGDS